jgi:hypothetical protein
MSAAQQARMRNVDAKRTIVAVKRKLKQRLNRLLRSELGRANEKSKY